MRIEFSVGFTMTEAVKAQGFQDKVTFSCLPNAGQPSLSGGRYQFMSRPSYCASYVEPYIRAGARLVGGCCGTTPAHIKAMREQLDKYIAASKQAASSRPLRWTPVDLFGFCNPPFRFYG